MKRKRPKPKAQKPPPGPPPSLQYKVVELSTVDESSLERAVNTWVRQGWTLENVQFAMRESSKRPAMAFVFFTRADLAAEHDESAARAHLAKLAGESPRELGPQSAYARLVELASDDDEEPR